MLSSEKPELDVDFEIVENPEDPTFPRLPNVISHRGHRIKIIATVHGVPYPEKETDITMSASVHVLGSGLLNEKGHICHFIQPWGRAADVTVTYPSKAYPNLPFKIETIVSRDSGDDHLGQGPDYQAGVSITTSSPEDGHDHIDTSAAQIETRASKDSGKDSGDDNSRLCPYCQGRVSSTTSRIEEKRAEVQSREAELQDVKVLHAGAEVSRTYIIRFTSK